MITRCFSFRVLLVALSLVIPIGNASAVTLYTVTDLGTLFGGSDRAYGVNDSGQAGGTSGARAVLYANGTVTNLGTLPGGTTSVGLGINNSGQVVGYSNTSGAERGFIYSSGVMTPLGSLTGGPSNAYGINDSGQAVGSSVASNGSLHAVLYGAGGAPTDLGTLGGPESHAYAINNNSQIAGYATALVTYVDAYGNPYVVEETHAFLHSSGVMNDLGKLTGATYSYAYGINNSGQVVGWSGNAFLFSGGVMTDLGTLPGQGSFSKAYGINDSGDVVGAAYMLGLDPDPFHSQARAFIFKDGIMSNLNSLIDPVSGWTLQEARDVNETGQIVGWGLLNGQTRAFLMTPTAVPLPGAFWLFGSGLTMLMAIRRRKNR